MLRHTILLILLICIFITQLVFTLTSHASVLRCSMCHSLVLAMITLTHIRKLGIKNSFEAQRFITFWMTVCYVTMVSLCIVNIIYSLQLILLCLHSHYHELDVHYPKYMLILGFICLFVQLLSFVKLDCGLTTRKSVDYVKKILFFLLPSTSVVVIAILRILANKQIIALADPSLHLLTNVLVAWSIYSSLKEHLLILLLAVPKSMNLENIKDSFREKIPEAQLSNLMIWRDSKTSINVNVKIMVDETSNLAFSAICSQIKEFFSFYGAQNVCVEPVYVLK